MKTSEIHIPATNNIVLKGNLNIPSNPNALVIFSHGSGSSRFSSRNRYVAEILNKNNIATLLTDLLTEGEDKVYSIRFDISLLTARLLAVTGYTRELVDLKGLPVGYFGASTGAASALKAAAYLYDSIQGIVCRGGRPDLVIDILPQVKSPTLLIVGGLDIDVINLNKQAYSKLTCEKDLTIVQDAGHLFEEPNKLSEVADLAVAWFNKYLVFSSTLTK